MEISSRTLVQSRPLNSPEAALAREMIEASRLPDGYEAQLQTDMTAFPKRWLERFKENDVSVAVLKDDQTLADTPILHALEEAQIAEIVSRGKPLVEKAVEEIFGPLRGHPDEDYQKYQATGILQEKIHELSNQTNLGFTAEVGREALDLGYLGGRMGFDPTYDPESFERWKTAFTDINEKLGQVRDGVFQPRDGIYIVPYLMYRGKTARALSLPSYQQFKGLDFQNNLGANFPENRLVILHESVVPNPSSRAGKHRVALHELGHMVDWICKELPETKDTHEQKVNQLYRQGMQSNSLITDRARDSAGEMMAEAVEAYLTVEESDNFYKPENHRENLQKSFPELYNYVDYLINLA
ncbi:MAG: hypothetical protein KF760_13755 [Candidatus Eremiobacteraeota bacterium]|nr:hypothetical protein [Candidatus Eremiobacteraeota bacterium]MCW5870654.1 hypothetical protein [Candidatus Eremiobacteraeota bacterium]